MVLSCAVRLSFSSVAAILLGIAVCPWAAGAQTPEQVDFFEKRVRPVLANNCYGCHSLQAPAPLSGLRLDSREALLKGGDRGPAIVPGDPSRSRLIQAVRHQTLMMPPNGELAETEIVDLERWVGRQMIITRRLLEKGVRFVQVYHGAGQPWDSHNEIAKNHGNLGKECDQPIGAFLKDLKQRGMLDDTLVIWGGEFGRTPAVELTAFGSNPGVNGRDHNSYGFSMWLAGGGVKGGFVHGSPDEFGFRAVDKPVHGQTVHRHQQDVIGYPRTGNQVLNL